MAAFTTKISLTHRAESITMAEMNDKTTGKRQESPRSVRLWAENAIWLEGMSEMYGNFNAALNIAVLKARGKGEWEIEQECAKYMKAKAKGKK